MLSLCLNFKTKSTEANFALLCYFRAITKKKKQKNLNWGNYLENVLPLTSAVLQRVTTINT